MKLDVSAGTPQHSHEAGLLMWNGSKGRVTPLTRHPALLPFYPAPRYEIFQRRRRRTDAMSSEEEKGDDLAMRLVLCFDGTWETPDTNPDPSQRVETNVCRFYEAIDGTSPDGAAQKKWYETGVGTNWYDRVAGGAFGLGIDQKIQEGYLWLANAYPDPDAGDVEVFVVGFSRGAYSARSLVGLIRKCGLLLPENAQRIDDAYQLYRCRGDGPDSDQATAFRARYSREINIKFLGVWETVGALGIPLPALQQLNDDAYAFHDTELSGIVENAAHAAGIDEHRIDYQVSLWAPVAKPNQNVEQRWFVGAHADVGGGDVSRRLSDIALAWMLRRASAAGLAIDPAEVPPIGQSNWMCDPSDSYSTFLDGLYAKTHQPFYRPMQLGNGSGEVLDVSVRKHCAEVPTYAPKNPGFEL
jgi:uncharacterized protein (DUF2235 family)